MIDIEDLVRKQIALYRAYDIRAENEERSGRGKQGKLSYGPYLLISREKGAGGSEVGNLEWVAPFEIHCVNLPTAASVASKGNFATLREGMETANQH